MSTPGLATGPQRSLARSCRHPFSAAVASCTLPLVAAPHPSRNDSPTWSGGARRACLVLPDGTHRDALVADTAERRRVGWSGAPPPAPGSAILFAFDVEALHGFWMRGVGFDLDLVQLDRDGIVLEVHRLAAGSDALVYPPEPIRYALELPAGEAAALGLGPGARVGFEAAQVQPVPPEHDPEPPVDPDPSDDPALVERWSLREHAYSGRRFAAAAALMRWQLRVAPHDVALWLHAGGAFVVHPPLCPLGPLEALGRSLGLAWVRLELAPVARLLLPDGRVVVERFDPRHPEDWLARMRTHGLFPTTGRWQQTRTLVVDLGGDPSAIFARLPPRIRYEARLFERALQAGRFRVEAAPGGVLDQRQERAMMALHAAWLAARPDAEDNLAFCRPIAHAFGPSVTMYLCWEGTALLAVQLHVLWQGTLYYLFSETVANAPQGVTPGLLWHGIVRAKTAPFGPSPAPDLLDLVGSFDPRYPDFRAFGKGYTGSKLRWHPTSVWLPPSVAFPGLELPP